MCLPWACVVLARTNLKQIVQRIYERKTELISREVCSFPMNVSCLCITELNLEERSALLSACGMHSGMRGAALGSEVFFRVDLQWIKNTSVLKLSFNGLFAKCDKLHLHH